MKLTVKLLATLLLGSLFFTACHNNDSPGTTPLPVPTLSVDKTTINQPATAGTASIAVTSNGDWKVAGLPNWISVNNKTGSGNESIIFYISANSSADVRVGNIDILSSGAGGTSSGQTIRITQETTVPYLKVDKTIALEKPRGQAEYIIVTSNTSWTLNIPATANWISADKTTSEAGVTTVRYFIAANRSLSVRTADVIYSATGITTPLKTNFIQQVAYVLKMPSH